MLTPASTAILVTLASDSAWRPIGGQAHLILTGKGVAPLTLSYWVCFGWHVEDVAKEKFIAAEPAQVTDIDKDGDVHLAATVPPMDKAAASWEKLLIRRGDIRLLGITSNGGLVLDATRSIGITTVTMALIVTTVIIALALLVLRQFIKASRLTKRNFLLLFITTGKGYASLSQFQIMVWTLVTAVSAVYVMALSGNLIDITSRTLILLGITGVTVIGSKLQSGQADRAAANMGVIGQAAPPPAPIAPAHPESPVVAPAVGAPPANAGGLLPRTPKWSDLIVTDDAGTTTEVTRVQMFFFTIIAASFVLIKVFNSYSIPDIPDGFLFLMGISNGVYLANKFLT